MSRSRAWSCQNNMAAPTAIPPNKPTHTPIGPGRKPNRCPRIAAAPHHDKECTLRTQTGKARRVQPAPRIPSAIFKSQAGTARYAIHGGSGGRPERARREYNWDTQHQLREVRKVSSARTERKPGNGTSDGADKRDRINAREQDRKSPRTKYLTQSRAAGPTHRRHVVITASVVSRNAPNPPGPNRTPTVGPPRSQLWRTSPSCGQLQAVGTPPPCAAGTARQSTMTQKSDGDTSSRRRGA